MKDYLDKVKEEMKRVDHIIYVSLKYTRTVDVIRHAIDRMISAFDHGMEAILQKVKRRRKTLEIPVQPIMKCNLVREIFKDDEEMNKFLDFYLLLRSLAKADYAKREEYRRHVTMISELDSGKKEINIDILNEYEKIMKDFVEHLTEFLGLSEDKL